MRSLKCPPRSLYYRLLDSWHFDIIETASPSFEKRKGLVLWEVYSALLTLWYYRDSALVPGKMTGPLRSLKCPLVSLTWEVYSELLSQKEIEPLSLRKRCTTEVSPQKENVPLSPEKKDSALVPPIVTVPLSIEKWQRPCPLSINRCRLVDVSMYPGATTGWDAELMSHPNLAPHQIASPPPAPFSQLNPLMGGGTSNLTLHPT